MYRSPKTIAAVLVLLTVASLAELAAEEFRLGDGRDCEPVAISEPEDLLQDQDYWLTDYEQPPAAVVEPPPAEVPTPPAATRPSLLSRLQSRPSRVSTARGLASVPFMIGDTNAGTCFAVATIGYLDLRLSHPTLTCGRLNVSEQNRALPTDRMYVSYRHFANATRCRLFQFSEDFDIDQFTVAGEKTCADGRVSFELRVPLSYRLNSEPFSRAYDIVPGNGDGIFDLGEGDGIIDPETFHLFGHRELELGNMSVILKSLLYEDDTFAFSGGLGVTMPTAEDVHYSLDFQNILITYAELPDLAVLAGRYRVDLAVDNQTVYLAPFAAWLWKPRERLFHHGFFQVEVAANSCPVHMRDFDSIGIAASGDELALVEWAINPPDGATVDLNAQTLMRLNLGIGYICYENPEARYLQQVAGLLEVHYTTPLDDARLSRFPLDLTLTDLSGNVTAIDAYDPLLGNLANRVDIVNLATGVSTTVGKTVVTNGFIVPLRTGQNRGFDFEYNCQVQRTF